MKKTIKKFRYECSQWMKLAYISAGLALVGGFIHPVVLLFNLILIVFCFVMHFVRTKKIGNLGLGLPLFGNRVSINQVFDLKTKGCPYSHFFKSMKKFKEEAEDGIIYYTYTHQTIIDHIEKEFDIVKIEECKEGTLFIEKLLLELFCKKCHHRNGCPFRKNGKDSRMFYCVEFKKRPEE